MVPLAQVITGTGELLEQTSPLSGGAWTTSAQILKGLSIVRRNAEVHHFDPLGAAGHAATPWRWMRAGPGGGR